MIEDGKVPILGITYTIAFEELDDENGYISPRRQHIGIRHGMNDELVQQTVLHEIIHGVLDQLGYHELYEDERLVQGLAIGLHQAFY